MGILGTANADDMTMLGNNKANKANLSHTMNWGNCMKYNWVPKGLVICGSKLCGPPGKKELRPLYAPQFDIDYWEPSEIIEVSCRKGYSLLAPGRVSAGSSNTGSTSPQSCFVPNGKGGRKWFFEARVWAVNGYLNGTREQSSNPSAVHLARQCTKDTNDNSSNMYAGYGIKFDKFSKGAPTGPGGAFEAFVSDGDQTWQKDPDMSPRPQTAQSACSDKDVEKCWGNMIRSGWVNHPNQAVAAATAAWRAHTIAVNANKVSPPGSGGEVSGYKINMDYPFLYNTSPYGSSMGIEGSARTSGFMGSECFLPGDPGPKWYTFQEKNLMPTDIPNFVNNLKDGDISKQAEIHTGVYIFTVWVYTKCIRYGSKDFHNYHAVYPPEAESCKEKLPWGSCRYRGKS
jgi:hypothetical protein